MRNEDFQVIELPQPGTFRLVEDSTLSAILTAHDWINVLKVPADPIKKFGFAVKLFRSMKDLSIVKLSIQTGIHRHQLKLIEKGLLERGPQRSTVHRLAQVLGEELIRFGEFPE